MNEPDHIPVPAEHVPRKETIQQNEDDLLVYEVDNPSAWITAEEAVPVRQ